MTQWIRHYTCDSVVVSSSPAVDKKFSFVILGYRSFQLELAYANAINHDIHLANTLF